jgi:deoxyribonuclease (pyrimidine dimer)
VTRINLVDPKALTDQHLIAEYLELPMVFGSLKRTLNSKTGFDPKKIKKRCPLGGGHIYFFYDKLGYLKKRYLKLIKEMHRRGFNPSPDSRKTDLNQFPKHLYRDYRPSQAEKDLLKKRILSRIKRKPEWYKYMGKQIILPEYQLRLTRSN